MATRFSFDNAFLHFAKTEGPRGFLWKYLLAYLFGALCLMAISYLLFRPLINMAMSAIFEIISAGMSEPEADQMIEALVARRATEIAGWIVMGNISMLVLGVLFWAVFEAAVQRRLVRDEGFSLQIGADEFRLMLIGLIWFGLAVTGQIVSIIFILVSTASLVYALDNPAGGAIAVLGCLALVSGIWIWIGVRLAPASAMTIRDGKIAFFDAWHATKGRFWPLFGAYVVLAIFIAVLSYFTFYVVGTSVAAAVMENIARFERAVEAQNPFALLSAILHFDILAPLIGGGVFWILMQGFFFYVWAGPAALAAKTDPRGGGVAQAPDVFA
ncbi:MAG: hypothetical protein RIB03_00015 [Henriciella sp.]|uniref:hypothetical protein n=1 Tax=Henriciella sp. TaxID=1968823 RepID=UPI0032EED33D